MSEPSSNAVAVVRRPIKGAIILLVDDDEAVREVNATMLRTSGYAALEVGSGGAALDLPNGDANIDLAILDFAMPGMNGVEVARQIHFRFPNLPVLFITGYVDQSVLAEIDEARIVKKPFVGEELAKQGAGLAHPGSQIDHYGSVTASTAMTSRQFRNLGG